MSDSRLTDAPASLGEIARYFLILGAVAFGGPAAHVAMMEDQVVRQRRWLTREEFLDLLGIANLIPGPSSTELAIFIGYRRAGWRGLIVAGSCFIAPAFLIVLALAAIYRRYGALPAVNGVLYGVKPVVIAVVIQALIGLGRAALKTWWLAAVAACAVAASACGLSPLLVLALGGGLALLPVVRRAGVRTAVWLPASLSGLVTGGTGFGLWPLFAVFLKVGAILFGSGYVLLAFLNGDLVQRLHWLTAPELLDAVAVGQVTPGPVFTTATFIGYVLMGLPGAAVATLAIFLPSFVYVGVSGRFLPRLRRSPLAGTTLDGVIAASLALMAVVCVELARAALVDPLTVAILIVSVVLLLSFRVNSAWLIAGAAALGFASVLMRHPFASVLMRHSG